MKKSFFERVGLQFFADEGAPAPEVAESAGDAGDAGGAEGGELEGFEAGFDDIGDLGEESELKEQPEQNPQVEQQNPLPAADMVQIPAANGQSVQVPKQALDALNQAFGGQFAQILQRGIASQPQSQQPQISQEIQLLDSYAKAAGYTDRQSYMQAMQQQLSQFQVQNELANLKKQYPNAPEQALTQLAQQNIQVRNQQAQMQRQYAHQQMQAAAQAALHKQQMERSAALVRPYQEFLKQYPNIDIKSLDKEFFQMVDSGLHPSAAYERQQANIYKNQLAAMRKNQSNLGTSIGSMQGQDVESDPFLSGFEL